MGRNRDNPCLSQNFSSDSGDGWGRAQSHTKPVREWQHLQKCQASVRPGYQDAASSVLRLARLLSSHFLVLTVKTSDKFSHCRVSLKARGRRLIINVIFSPCGCEKWLFCVMHEFDSCPSWSRKDNDNFDWASWAEQKVRNTLVCYFELFKWKLCMTWVHGSFLGAQKRDYMSGCVWFVFRSLPLYIIPCNSLCGGRSPLSLIV